VCALCCASARRCLLPSQCFQIHMYALTSPHRAGSTEITKPMQSAEVTPPASGIGGLGKHSDQYEAEPEPGPGNSGKYVQKSLNWGEFRAKHKGEGTRADWMKGGRLLEMYHAQKPANLIVEGVRPVPKHELVFPNEPAPDTTCGTVNLCARCACASSHRALRVRCVPYSLTRPDKHRF
jgi:hypothetical protein